MWPRLAQELIDCLREADESALASMVPELEVLEPCGCGDDFCQSIGTAPRVVASPPQLRDVWLDPPWPGYLIVTVVDGRITFVEVLYREPLD